MKRTPAWRGWRWLVIVLAVAAVLNGRAEDDDEDNNDGPARFHDVKSWRGTLKAQARVDPAAIGLIKNLMVGRGKGAEMTYDFSAYQVIEFVLTEYESDPSVWTGKVIGSHYTGDYRFFLHMPENYANNQTWWKGYSDHEGSYSASGPLDFGDDPVAELKFHRQRGWSVHIGTGRRTATEHKRWYRYIPPKSEQDPEHDLIIGESFTKEEENEITVAALNGTGTHPYPEKGLALVAHEPGREGSSPSGIGGTISPAVLWEYTVSLEPTSMEELRLVIEEPTKPTKYADWRPETTPDAAAGPELIVTVRLETLTGGKPKVGVKKFVWELIGTSKEPGVTMNYPVDAKDHRFDLDLGADGEFFVLSNENQKMERIVREGFTDKAKVVPYDWGGWSTLQVTAYMTDGRAVIGKLKGESEPGLRVPKRDAHSYIADAWKKKTGASGADNSDDDNAPRGDGSKGDGLTLYEEYRGWYENGKRLEGLPKTKDFFVYVRDAGIAVPGIVKFETITKLKVHYALTKQEFPESRIINANRDRGAHRTDQHGVIIQVNKELKGYAIARGGPGNPKSITVVDLMSNAATKDPRWLKSTVAHELGHCVNLWHHGESDDEVNWTVRDGQLYEEMAGVGTGLPIVAVDEGMGPRSAEMIGIINQLPGKAMKLWLGRIHGQHSGNDNCMMRYDCGEIYIFRPRPNYRVVLVNESEQPGFWICQSPAGFGVNSPGRNPIDRYGAAAENRGNCEHQILVSDERDAPRR